MTLLWDEVAKGSIVQIRSVGDLLDEFGDDGENGYPKVDVGWDSNMGDLCGMTCRVVQRIQHPDFIELYLEPEDASDPRWSTVVDAHISLDQALFNFNWSAELVELVAATAVVEAPEVSALLQLLGPPPASAITAPPR